MHWDRCLPWSPPCGLAAWLRLFVASCLPGCWQPRCRRTRQTSQAEHVSRLQTTIPQVCCRPALALALCSSNTARTSRCSDAALLKPSLTFRGPPRQRQPREDGNEEDKENQGDETQGQQPPQRRYRRNFNYRRRRPENPKPQDGKETKTAEPPAENTSAPEAEQGGAE